MTYLATELMGLGVESFLATYLADNQGGGGTILVVTTVVDLPASADDGTIAYIEDFQALYIYDGGWIQLTPWKLQANTDFYVSTTGNDNNDGTTPATAWATLQKAWDFLSISVDYSEFTATVNISDGSYAGANSQEHGGDLSPKVSIIWQGNSSTPDNVEITDNSFGYGWYNTADLNGFMFFEGMNFNGAFGFHFENGGGHLVDFHNINFGPNNYYVLTFVSNTYLRYRFNTTFHINCASLYYAFASYGGTTTLHTNFTIDQPLSISNYFLYGDNHGRFEIGSFFASVGSAVTGEKFRLFNGCTMLCFDSSPDAMIGSISGRYSKDSVITVPNYIQDKTSDYTVTYGWDRYRFSNRGTSALVNFTLPSAIASTTGGFGYMEYEFLCENVNGIRITASGTDTINLTGAVSAAGGRLDSTQVGSVVKLISVASGEWYAEYSLGLWTVT